MFDFQIQNSSPECHSSQHKFVPGEVFYSVLLTAGADVIRHDFCQNAWEGPPEGTIGWWKSTMPDDEQNKLNLAPKEVMLQYFEQLYASPESQDMAYVLSLLMVRKRIMRLNGSEEDEQGNELMVLSEPKSEKEYKVPVTQPTVAQVESLQQQLTAMLYKDAA
jgi:hypothetical protein